MLWHLFRWMTRYFTQIDQGIDALLQEGQGQICLSPEMLPFERKLNAVKQELEEAGKHLAQIEEAEPEPSWTVPPPQADRASSRARKSAVKRYRFILVPLRVDVGTLQEASAVEGLKYLRNR